MNTRKLAALLLALSMVFALAACGGGSSTPAPAEDEAEGAAVFKIGGIGPTTGPAAVYGTAVKNGMQIAVDEINAAGGAFTFEYNFQDDEHDAEKSVNAYNQLKDWGMQLLVGTVTTNPCIAVGAETNADRMFELTPSASSQDVTAGKDNVFQLCFTDPNQGTTSARLIAEEGYGEKIAIIYNNADAYSTGITNAFKAEAEKHDNIEIVSETTFASDDNADFSAQLNDAKNNGADLVFMPIYYTPASLILKQADGMGYDPTFFGVDGMDGILTLDGFDTKLAEGLMLMTPFNPWSTDSKVTTFVEEYEGRFGEKPNQFAADGYDCVYAIYNLLQEAGATADMDMAELCELLIPAFTGGFSYDGLTGSNMQWSSNGEVSKDPVVCVIQNAEYVDM